MKHSPTVWKQPQKDGKRLRRAMPVVPLVKSEPRKLKKSDYEIVELLTDPNDPESLRRKVEIPYLPSGGPLEYIEFRKNLEKVIAGQNATTGAQKFRILRGLLQSERQTDSLLHSKTNYCAKKIFNYRKDS